MLQLVFSCTGSIKDNVIPVTQCIPITQKSGELNYNSQGTDTLLRAVCH